MEDKPSPPATRRVPWSPLVAVVFVVLLYVVTQIVAGLLVSIYPALRHWTRSRANNWVSNSVIGQFVFVLLAEGLLVAFIYGFLRAFKTRLSVIGLKWPRWRDPAYGLMAFPVYFILYAALVAVVSHFYTGLNVNQQQQIGFNSVHGPLELTLTFVSLVVLPPLAEEIMFRGLLFTSLKKWLTAIWSAIFTSALFAAPHLLEGGSAGLLYIAGLDTFTLSLVLCFLRQKTDSLWPGIVLHALKNTVAFVSLFLLTNR